MKKNILKALEEKTKPIEVRDELLNSKAEDMVRRRKLVLLSVLGLINFNVISLLQSGVIKKLPDIPIRVFDTNNIITSKFAYIAGVPDAPVSNVLFAATMVLSTVGGSEKATRKPVFDILLGAVVLGHTIGAGIMLYDMLFRKKKLCMYCLAGAGVIFASAAIIEPVVNKNIKRIF
ncbi:vitamin K epoxide reductase family protein [Salegentibacter sp. F188]|uniref:Vitamin K epoxide reductase family protein n=1 Tax=Autumnicola patrickiae TaxID=3075591 RepID=A0ABU3E5R5_9FLAO|nr:vitamin K epoxide reductase family protein [Salegentibacter sp. F188]MDT0691342.1 vitamin K epoxide reductase family protein [Salegentibacter sp. F188]